MIITNDQPRTITIKFNTAELLFIIRCIMFACPKAIIGLDLVTRIKGVLGKRFAHYGNNLR